MPESPALAKAMVADYQDGRILIGEEAIDEQIKSSFVLLKGLFSGEDLQGANTMQGIFWEIRCWWIVGVRVGFASEPGVLIQGFGDVVKEIGACGAGKIGDQDNSFFSYSLGDSYAIIACKKPSLLGEGWEGF